MTKILAVIDMQHDFIDGALGSEPAKKIVPAVVDKILHFNGKIIATRDTHHADYLDTLEGKMLPVEHCVEGSGGWKIVPEVADAFLRRDADFIGVVDKPTFGSFELLDRVDVYPNIEEIEICGLCTDICVVSNALMLRAKYPDVKIVVDANLTEGVTAESKEAALDTMKACQIVVEGR